MASLIEALEIKRKMYFEYEGAPYHCLDVEVSRPTARGGQTLVRIKMRNLLTRAVFDKTFKAAEKFEEPDLVSVDAAFLYADSGGYHFMDQESFDTLTLRGDMLGEDRLLLVDNLVVQVQKFNGNAIGVSAPELMSTIASWLSPLFEYVHTIRFGPANAQVAMPNTHCATPNSASIASSARVSRAPAS